MKFISEREDEYGLIGLKLVMEDSEDVWIMYNIIATGDVIGCTSWRRVKGGLNHQKDTRKLLYLEITAEKVKLDSPYDGKMRVSGKTSEGAPDVPVNSYHSFDLEIGLEFMVKKASWDDMAMRDIKRACDPASKAELGAIVMQEGIAHICLVTETITHLRNKVEISMPRKKRGDNSSFEKAMRKFFETTFESMKRNLPVDKLKAIVIASPGFVARGYYDFMFQEAARQNDRTFLKSKPKFLVASSSTGFLQGLTEVLGDEAVLHQLTNTRYASNAAVLEKFYDTLEHNPNRAWYGPQHIATAADMGAISKLLIADTLFRSEDVNTRKQYIALSEQVKQTGGEVFVFSTLHDTGKQLLALSGIACILSYPLAELDDVKDDDDDEESDDEFE